MDGPPRDLSVFPVSVMSEREQFERLVERVPAVLYIDKVVPGQVVVHPTVYVGPQVEAILGITRQEWLAEDELWEQIVHPEDWPAISAEYAEYMQRGGVLVQEYRVVRPDRGIIWIRDDCTMWVDPRTGESIVYGVMLDITAQKHLEEQLRAAETKNRALIEQVPGVVWIEPLGRNEEAPFVSGGVLDLFGVGRDEWFATNWWESHLHPDDREAILQVRRSVAVEAGRFRAEYRMTTAAGRVIWIEEVSQVVLHDGQPWILQALLNNVTQRKRAEQQLEFRAYHDPLTGLANRPLFDASLDQALERARRQGSEVAVLFVDIDNFKHVNDNYGHEAGDEVLRVVGSRLQHCARGSDLVARRGGDEYLVLLPDIDAMPSSTGLPTALSAAEPSPRGQGRGDDIADVITRRIVESMRAPIDLPNGRISMKLSIGRCVYPWDAEDGSSMMAAADAHMYGEKSRPKTASPH